MQKPPIVMIHGLWSTPDYWDGFRAFFEEQGFQVHTPPLRHHDQSACQPVSNHLGKTSIRDYEADMERFIRQLPQPPILIGHSMGGLLCQMLLARNLGCVGLILASASPAGVFPIRPSMLPIMIRLLLKPGWWRKPFKLSRKEASYGLLHRLLPEDREHILNTMLHESGKVAFEIAFWFLDRKRATRFDPKAIKTPMLFLAGREDRITPHSVVRRTAKRYGEHATFHSLKGHAHWLQGEPGWEKISRLCLDFLHSTLSLKPDPPSLARSYAGLFQEEQKPPVSTALF